MNNAEKISAQVRQELPLKESVLPDEYFYQSLPICILDSVFSISTKYGAVQNVVSRYTSFFALQKFRANRDELPPRSEQESVSDLVAHFTLRSPVEFATEVVQNKQRTSAINGILKAEAVKHFAEAFKAHGVEHLQDIPAAMKMKDLKKAVRSITGQGSGITLRYLWMLAGSATHVKPDRMILRYLERAIRRPVEPAEAQSLIAAAVELLLVDFPQMTPRLLDYEMWRFESDLAKVQSD